MKCRARLRPVLCAAACLAASANAQQTNFWNANAGGQWTNVNLWADTGFYPDGVGDVAQFAFDIGANRAITLNDADGFITNGLLIVGDASHGYRFSVGSGTQWIFDDSDDLVEIRVTAASNTAGRNHMIFGAFTINDDLLVDHRVAGVNRAFRITNSIFEGAAGLDLFKVGVGQLNIEGTAAYSGMTSVDGGVLQLTNAGVLSASTNIVVHQGTLEINNAGSNIGDRIGDAAVLTSRGGGLTFSHDAAAATAFSETLDQLDFRSGNTLIQMTAGAADGSSALIFSNATAAIVRSGAGATARIEAPGLGTNAQNEILLVPGAGLPAPQNGIIPWVVVKDGVGGTGADYNLATTNTGTGGHIGITALTSYQQNPESIWIAADNVRPLGDETLSAQRFINALVLDDGIDLLGPTADRVLNFGTAGGAAVILQTGGTSTITNDGNFETILTFGNNQGIFHTIGDLTVVRGNSNEQIRGTNGFVKAGPGTLVLDTASSKDPTVANAMTGNFYVNEGTLELRRGGSGGATALVLDGGTLRLVNNANTTFGNDLVVNENGSVVVGRTTSGTGGVTMTLSNLSLAAGRTLIINRDAANFSATDQAYGVTFRDVTLLGDGTTLDVRSGKGNQDGTVNVDSITGLGGTNFSFAVEGNSVIRAVLNVNGALAANDFTLGAASTGALVNLADGATNIAGNIHIVSGILGFDTNFLRPLGTGAGEVRLTGGTEAGFSAQGGPVNVDLGGDGTGTGTNLVWGSETFNPGTLALNEDDANNVVTLMNDIDLNSGTGEVTRIISTYRDGNGFRAVVDGDLTDSGSGVVNFQKNNGGVLELNGQLGWNGFTRIAAGTLRIPHITNLPSGYLNIDPGNSIAVLETHGTLTRALGTNANEVRLFGGGTASQTSRPGFSALGGDFIIDLGGDGTGTGPEIVWATEFFDPDGPNNGLGGLILNRVDADGRLIFWNDMDLNGEAGMAQRRIDVLSTTAEAPAILMGDLRNSQAGSNPIGLNKLGAGILMLMGSNTYDGPTTVGVGTLLVNGSQIGGGAFSVIDSATLGGTGLISAPVWVTNGATVAPGSLGIGNLTVQGDVDIEGILSIEIDAAGAGFVDLLTVTGILDISTATLNFVTNGVTLDDTAYIFASYGTLITNDPTAGFGAVNFLPDGYQLDYNYLGGNQIALVIPEPRTWALLLLGGMALLAAWRRR